MCIFCALKDCQKHSTACTFVLDSRLKTDAAAVAAAECVLCCGEMVADVLLMKLYVWKSSISAAPPVTKSIDGFP